MASGAVGTTRARKASATSLAPLALAGEQVRARAGSRSSSTGVYDTAPGSRPGIGSTSAAGGRKFASGSQGVAELTRSRCATVIGEASLGEVTGVTPPSSLHWRGPGAIVEGGRAGGGGAGPLLIAHDGNGTAAG